jgi:hypothetical protein
LRLHLQFELSFPGTPSACRVSGERLPVTSRF